MAKAKTTKDQIFEDAKEKFDVTLDRRLKLSDLQEQYAKLESGKARKKSEPKIRKPKRVRNIFSGNEFDYSEYFKGDPDLEVIEWED